MVAALSSSDVPSLLQPLLGLGSDGSVDTTVLAGNYVQFGYFFSELLGFVPPELELVQNHGKVSWAVRSIWEYYATWFHYDSTTELYPVPARDVYADLAEAAGTEALLALGGNYLAQDEPVKTLHVVEVALAAEPGNRGALELRQQALQSLMHKAENGLRNDYEIYWLKARLADTENRLVTSSP